MHVRRLLCAKTIDPLRIILYASAHCPVMSTLACWLLCIAGASSEVVLNQLLKHTTVQSRFSCNMVALVDGLPQTLNLKQMLVEFLSFRYEQP